MGKTWVLDTETKGTGATMVPLEKRTGRDDAAGAAPWFRTRERPERAPRDDAPPAPRAPRRFRVVDVVSRRVLAEDADARETVDVLKGVRSVVDVRLSVRDGDAGEWRLLGLGEQKAIWALRDR
jgi:hypothetical protein